MEQIYLDRDQCDEFQVDYFKCSSISLRADAVLASKMQGYDRKHTDFLQKFGHRFILLTRTEGDAPGWYNVINSPGSE